MGSLNRARFRGLNRYSWSLIIAFICTAFAMHSRSISSFFEGFFQILPLVMIIVYWCEKTAYLISQPENKLQKIEIFRRDLFILGFSFLLGCFISLVLSYDNSDARGWWPLIVCFFTVYGLFFSLLFSVIAQFIKNHKTYTIVFSLLIITLVSFGNFLPRYLTIPFLGDIDTFYMMTGILLMIHLLLVIVYQGINIILKYQDHSSQ